MLNLILSSLSYCVMFWTIYYICNMHHITLLYKINRGTTRWHEDMDLIFRTVHVLFSLYIKNYDRLEINPNSIISWSVANIVDKTRRQHSYL